MGAPKPLLRVEGTPLIVLHVRVFSALGLKVHVVLGAQADHVASQLPAGVEVHVNLRWADTGPAESAWIALEHLGPALVTPVDVPPARPDTLRRLLNAPGPAVLRYQGREGHPVRLDPPHVPRRLDLRLAGALRIDVDDPSVVLNLNTPAEWSAWLASRSRTPELG